MNAQVKKANQTIKEIQAKGSDATAYDLQRLANAQLKVEQKSINYVYGQLKRAYNAEKPTAFETTIKEIVGANFPTLSAFKKAYKAKYVSMWGGMGVLRNLNPKFKRADKVKRQNKAQAKAVGSVVNTTIKGAKVKTAKA
jgi:hypothetical protein